jgi:uncharacterized OsmC-like protein
MSTRDAVRPDARLEQQRDYRFRVHFGSGAPALLTDEPPPLGTAAGPDPAALLAAAVGNCLASSLLFCARKSRIEPAGLDVDVRLTRERNEEGRVRIGRITVRLAPRLTLADRARIGRCLELFESFCVVTESIRRGIPVDVMVEPVTVAEPTKVEAGARPPCAA